MSSQVIGLEVDLRRGPVNPVFRTSNIPDFRYADDEYQLSPANVARYGYYLESLQRVKVHHLEFESRVIQGLRVKNWLRRPKFRVQEQASVQA